VVILGKIYSVITDFCLFGRPKRKRGEKGRGLYRIWHRAKRFVRRTGEEEYLIIGTKYEFSQKKKNPKKGGDDRRGLLLKCFQNYARRKVRK